MKQLNDLLFVGRHSVAVELTARHGVAAYDLTAATPRCEIWRINK